jgi:hypothetical protein
MNILTKTFFADYNLYNFVSDGGAYHGTHEIYNVNTTTYPLFISPDNAEFYSKNFHYLSGQPNIDAGTTIASVSTDKDGYARIGSWDIGAYEYSVTSSVDNKNECLVKIYPNPFTDNLTIEFSMINKEDVEVSLLDATGKSVKVITNRQFQQVKNTTSLDMTDLPAGLYFIQLKTNNSLTTQKLLKQ